MYAALAPTVTFHDDLFQELISMSLTTTVKTRVKMKSFKTFAMLSTLLCAYANTYARSRIIHFYRQAQTPEKVRW